MNFLKKVLVASAWLTVIFAFLFSYITLAQDTELQAELTSVYKEN